MDDCQEWTGFRFKNGYGRVGHRGYAHRAAWENANGPIPAGLEVMHLCDNPPCVNVAHLRVGTHAENMADMRSKGRSGGTFQVGHNAKLSGTDVREIRRRHAAGESGPRLAREFGVNRKTVWHICAGRRRLAAPSVGIVEVTVSW